MDGETSLVVSLGLEKRVNEGGSEAGKGRRTFGYA